MLWPQPFSNNAPRTFKCSSSPFDRGWLISSFVSLWVRVDRGRVIYWISWMTCHYRSSRWWGGGISKQNLCMQMQHRSEFFGLCFLILSWITVWIQNTKGFVYFLRVKVALVLSQLFIIRAFQPIQLLPWKAGCRHQVLASSRLARRLAKKYTHEECKECHEVNVMASQWNCGGGSVLWAEPGPWALPSSLSVWAAMMNTYPVLSLSGKNFFFPSWDKKG